MMLFVRFDTPGEPAGRRRATPAASLVLFWGLRSPLPSRYARRLRSSSPAPAARSGLPSRLPTLLRNVRDRFGSHLAASPFAGLGTLRFPRRLREPAASTGQRQGRALFPSATASALRSAAGSRHCSAMCGTGFANPTVSLRYNFLGSTLSINPDLCRQGAALFLLSKQT